MVQSKKKKRRKRISRFSTEFCTREFIRILTKEEKKKKVIKNIKFVIYNVFIVSIL